MWIFPGTQRDFSQHIKKVRITSFCGFSFSVFAMCQDIEDIVLFLVA